MNVVSNEAILDIANKLGLATEQVFEIFTKSIKGIALFNMFMMLLLIIGVCIITGLIYILGNDDDISMVFTIWLVTCLAYGFLLILCVDIVKPYLFPEYFAIKEMLKTLGL